MKSAPTPSSKINSRPNRTDEVPPVLENVSDDPQSSASFSSQNSEENDDKDEKKPMTFPEAMKSFIGYLEGTQKSANTISNYRSDLNTLQEFLRTGLSSEPVHLSDLTRDDLERYLGYLKAKGFKTNTRRRKLLTFRRLLRYLTQRKKFNLDLSDKLPAPQKLERVPTVIPYADLFAAVQMLPSESDIEKRNRLLFWTLLETGAQVSEVAKLRFENLQGEKLLLDGKAGREIPISPGLAVNLPFSPSAAKLAPWIFQGYNKGGLLSGPISPRGIELLVEHYRTKLGFDGLTPRAFRQAAVMEWHRQGLSKDEIRRRLGLKTEYAFRVYEPLFKAQKEASQSNN